MTAPIDLVKYPQIRKALRGPDHEEVYDLAVTTAVLALLGTVNATPNDRTLVIRTVAALVPEKGVGTVAAEIDHAPDFAAKWGLDTRIETTARELREVGYEGGYVEAALLMATFFVRGCDGMDREAERVLRAIGKEAGVSEDNMARILAAEPQ